MSHYLWSHQKFSDPAKCASVDIVCLCVLCRCCVCVRPIVVLLLFVLGFEHGFGQNFITSYSCTLNIDYSFLLIFRSSSLTMSGCSRLQATTTNIITINCVEIILSHTSHSRRGMRTTGQLPHAPHRGAPPRPYQHGQIYTRPTFLPHTVLCARRSDLWS